MTTSRHTTPQQLVEHALATSTADDCIAIVRDVTSANLRWANNTLTTNGVMTEVSVTVVSFASVAGGIATGSVSGSAATTDFWGSMEAVGGPDTWVLGGAFNCGKAQPGQVAAVSHGCPSALFRGVNILNTLDEAGN